MPASNRILLWTVAAIAAVLLLVPVVGPLVTDAGMAGDGTTPGMHVAGVLWFVSTFVVTAALVALVRRQSRNS